MARKVRPFTITQSSDDKRENRDKGKVFILTEMSASQAEKWAVKAFLALARAGVDMPDNLKEAGFAGIAVYGLKSFGGIDANTAFELMDEMFGCIAFQPDPTSHPEIVRPLREEDIEEVATRAQLRLEVFALHAGFSSAADLLNWIKSQAA